MNRRRQCEWHSTVTRIPTRAARGQTGRNFESGPPRRRARARVEEEAEAVLTGLEAAVTRIDDSSDDEPSCQRGGMRSASVKKWVEGQKFQLDSLEGSVQGRHDSTGQRWSHSCSVSLLCRSEVDECSSAGSESSWVRWRTHHRQFHATGSLHRTTKLTGPA